MECKIVNNPFYNPDLNYFYMEFLKLLRTAKEDSDKGIEVDTALSISIPGSNKVFNLSLSEISHIGNELLNLTRLSELPPVGVLLSLYVITDIPKKALLNYSIKTDVVNNTVSLKLSDSSIEYILEDFTEAYRTMLKHSILKLDNSNTIVREDFLGNPRDFTIDFNSGKYSLDF